VKGSKGGKKKTSRMMNDRRGKKGKPPEKRNEECGNEWKWIKERSGTRERCERARHLNLFGKFEFGATGK
jgi:hypothetical protein